MMVGNGKLLSFWDGNFSGAMFNSGGVYKYTVYISYIYTPMSYVVFDLLTSRTYDCQNQNLYLYASKHGLKFNHVVSIQKR